MIPLIFHNGLGGAVAVIPVQFTAIVTQDFQCLLQFFYIAVAVADPHGAGRIAQLIDLGLLVHLTVGAGGNILLHNIAGIFAVANLIPAAGGA